MDIGGGKDFEKATAAGKFGEGVFLHRPNLVQQPRRSTPQSRSGPQTRPSRWGYLSQKRNTPSHRRPPRQCSSWSARAYHAGSGTARWGDDSRLRASARFPAAPLRPGMCLRTSPRGCRPATSACVADSVPRRPCTGRSSMTSQPIRGPKATPSQGAPQQLTGDGCRPCVPKSISEDCGSV